MNGKTDLFLRTGQIAKVVCICLAIILYGSGLALADDKPLDSDASVDSPQTTCWFDLDGDGFGDPNNPFQCAGDCTCQPDLVDNDLDCDDSDPSIYPGATELCNGQDDDCNGTVDDNAVDCITWYPDADGDGFGFFNGQTICACTQPQGFVDNDDDCDDDDPSINPTSPEICNNIDDNCNTQIDENAIDCTDWYPDNDGDGYGMTGSQPICECEQPPGHVPNDLDCNDTDGSVNPGGIEVCDLQDNDCNGTIDDNPVGCINFYPDSDGDGYGDINAQPICACSPIQGQVSDNTDCDDSDAGINPGAEDIPGDNIDQDCDGQDAVACCTVPGDANSDGAANVGDAVFLINFVFKGGDAPVCVP